MQQDFHFKIVHCASSKYANVDALSRNLVDKYKADEDFGNEIQDLVGITQDASKPSFHKDNETIINLFTVLTEEEEDHDVDHYERREELIAFKVETPPQVETCQRLVVRKN
jgi:antirestriction protein